MDVVPTEKWDRIEPSRNFNVQDAKNSKTHTNGIMNLAVEIRNHVQMVKFNIVKRLLTNVHLECHYCDRDI